MEHKLLGVEIYWMKRKERRKKGRIKVGKDLVMSEGKEKELKRM